MFRFRKSLMVFTIFAAAATPPRAAEPLTFYTEEWKPFNYLNDKNEIDGFTTAIIKKIAQNLGTETKTVLVPWSRALDTVQKTKGTAIYSIYRIPERENLFKWVGPIYQVDTMLWGLKSRKLPINSIEDAKGYRISVQASSAYAIALEKKGFDKDKLTLNYSQTDINMVLAGRADLVPLSLFSIGKLNDRAKEFSAGNPGAQNAVPQWQAYAVLASDSIYLGFNHDTPDELIDAWQKELINLKRMPFYKELEKNYILSIVNEAKGIQKAIQ